MTTIGIYDSGIGGLTSMAKIAANFGDVDFYYLADNANMPFGTKSDDEIEEIIYNGVKKLEAHSDVSVLACNTASMVTDLNDVFKLLPDVESLERETSLVLATPLTLAHLNAGSTVFNTADTRELATLTEVRAALAFKSKTGLDASMSALSAYLKERLQPFYNVKTVVLGCSHYGYLKNEIIKLFGAVRFRDGNGSLISHLSPFLSSCRVADENGIGAGRQKSTSANKPSPKIEFAFTGRDEREKYEYVYACLLSENSNDL